MATENLPISGLYPLTGALTPNDLLVISQELPEGWQSFNVEISKFVDLVVEGMNEAGVFMRKVYTLDDNGLVGQGTITNALGLNWDYLRSQFAPITVGNDYVPLVTRIIAGNGLTGGGDLTANRSLVLGTPSTISAVTTNLVSAESHTHAIDKASTSVAGVVKLIDTVTSTSVTEAPTARVVKVLNDGKVDKTTIITAGAGLTGGGDLTVGRSVVLGVPSTLNETSTNNVSATSHTHAIDKASTAAAGLVKLNDTLISNSVVEAATAKTVKTLNDTKTDKTVQVTAGVGLTGGGDLTTNRTVSMGVPSTVTSDTVNAATATTHTHAIDKASTAVAGVVKLNDTLVSTSLTEAPTANAVKSLNDLKAAKSVTITTGWGLTGGGNLSANRSIDLNFSELDTRYAATGVGSAYAPLTRVLTAGTGLTGGGDLTANRTFAVSFGTAVNTVAMGNDGRILNGQTAFGWGNHASQAYLKTVALRANSGLLGNGTNATNGLGIDYAVLNTRYLPLAGGTINGDLTINGKLNAAGLDTGIPIGAVMWFNCYRPSLPDGWVALDGQLLTRTAFPDLWVMVRDKKVPIVTEALWLTAPTSTFANYIPYSYRNYYTVGNGSSTFRIPDTNGVQTGSIQSPVLRGDGKAGGDVGYTHGDSIRNITGDFSGVVPRSSTIPAGVFNRLGTNFSGVDGNGSAQQNYNFDASRIVPTSNENSPASVFGVMAIKARGGTSSMPASGSPATLLANQFNGSQKIVGDLEVTGNVNFANVNNLPMLGIGQKYKVFITREALNAARTARFTIDTKERLIRTFYYNTDVAPRHIFLHGDFADATMQIGDALWRLWDGDVWGAVSFIVPPGEKYALWMQSNLQNNILSWVELGKY